MNVRFILNPCSGRNRRRPGLAEVLRNFIRRHGLDADLELTAAPGHATELAAAAVVAGARLVVAVGGDGTLNEVARGLVGSGTALALVPCGSGNGLARHLGIPVGLGRALDLIADAPARMRWIDTGSVNGLLFLNVMGLGLDAEAGRRFNLMDRRGLPGYVRTAWAAWRERRVEDLQIEVHGRVDRVRALLLAGANSDQYGNNARIAPGARVDDGQLDLVTVGPVGLPGAAAVAARLFAGSLDRDRAIRRWRAAQFVVQRPSPGLIHTDGETWDTAARLEISVRPASLRVLVPGRAGDAGRPWDDLAGLRESSSAISR